MVLAAGTKLETAERKRETDCGQRRHLLVDPDEAERLTLASSEGKIQLALRNPLDRARPVTRGVRPAWLIGAAPPVRQVSTRRTGSRRPSASLTSAPPTVAAALQSRSSAATSARTKSCAEEYLMAITVCVKASLFSCSPSLGGGTVLWAQLPATAVVSAAPGSEVDAGAVRLLVGRSTVLDVGTAITRVSLTSADIADAMVTSPNQLLINGKLPGAISMFVWDRAGALKRYEVIVQRDLARLTEQIRTLFPGEKIEVSSSGKNVVLSGLVTNKDIIEKAVNVAAGYVDKREEVVALLQLQAGAPSNQVLLRVRFAEVSRSALTELGASLFTSPTGIKNTIGRVTTQQFPAPGFDGLEWTKESGDFGAPVTSARASSRSAIS